MQANTLARILRALFFLGLALLIVPALSRTYLMGPLFGSQDRDHVAIAYTLNAYYPYLVVLGLALIIPHIAYAIRTRERRRRMSLVFLVVFLLGLNYLTGVKMNIGAHLRPMSKQTFAAGAANLVADSAVVIGVEFDGRTKAYPLQLLAAHGCVADTIGRTPVIVTYSVLCHAARVYRTTVGAVRHRFGLVAMQQYSAVFSDEATGSWWLQTTGEAVEGPLKGSRLEIVPWEQIELGDWKARHPNTLVLQPDSAFLDEYRQLAGFDHMRVTERGADGRIVRGNDYGWAIGVRTPSAVRGYDWNDLLERRVIEDRIGDVPIVIALANDTTSFHVWRRDVAGVAHSFRLDSLGNGLRDVATNALWNWSGECTEGERKGTRLTRAQALLEFWHSWRRFNPGATQWAAR